LALGGSLLLALPGLMLSTLLFCGGGGSPVLAFPLPPRFLLL
jgi:hypothetical protein